MTEAEYDRLRQAIKHLVNERDTVGWSKGMDILYSMAARHRQAHLLTGGPSWHTARQQSGDYD